MLIGVVGLNGSGKDSVGKILVKGYGYEHKDLGQAIRDELKVLGKNILDRNEMVSLANERRKNFGNDYWVKKTLSDYVPGEKLVLTSIRNPAEAELIQHHGGIIVEVYAPIKKRFERIVERVESGEDLHGEIKFDDFKEKEERELKSNDPSKQQLLKCIVIADKKINNSGSLKDLESEVKYFMQNINR
jgi:dephospho-CoA kinase